MPPRGDALELELGVIEALHHEGLHLPAPATDQIDPRWLALVHAVALVYFDELGWQNVAWLARDQVVNHPSPSRAARQLAAAIDLATSRVDVAATRQVGAQLIVEMGYTADYPGGVALFCDIHAGRTARVVVHPLLGAECLQWAGVHRAQAPAGLIESAVNMVERWNAASPSDRVLIEHEFVERCTEYCDQRTTAGFTVTALGL